MGNISETGQNYGNYFKAIVLQTVLQIARIPAPLDEMGPLTTMQISDYKTEIEIWRFCACPKIPGISLTGGIVRLPCDSAAFL